MNRPHPPLILSRRGVLAGGLLTAAACSSGTGKGATASRSPSASASARPAVIRRPNSLPNPHLPAGTDTLPEIDHIVVVMQENHSYDNYLGMLRRGDGFTLDADGHPTAANRDATGRLVRAFRMPGPCQPQKQPDQSWTASQIQLDAGRNDGFVRSQSGTVAMGYWTADDLPFYYGLASTFPLADRYFASVLAQTYPNRRFLMAGTAYGAIATSTEGFSEPPPANGTIFNRLNAHGISWKNYYSSLPSTLIIPSTGKTNASDLVPIKQFYADAAAGTLPSVCIVDPDFNHESEENPENIQLGEAFSARVINAVMQGPGWSKTLLIWTYDEGGGYYDHVPPPAAIRPDAIAPKLAPGMPRGQYNRYGFRVPTVIVSPLARRDYVSHVVHDHTSILKLVETKWNLPALTFRDANASNLLDSLDLKAKPAFLTPPTLPKPALAGGKPATC